MLHPTQIADSLSERFHLHLSVKPNATQARDTGVSYTIRCDAAEAPNGFSIAVSSHWRSVEAVFVPDPFAVSLIQTMGAASVGAGSDRFRKLLEAFRSSGTQIELRVSGTSVNRETALPALPWSEFNLRCRRLADPSVQQEQALEASSACLALVLTLLPIDVEQYGTDGELGLPEGALTRVEVNRYERRPENRAACIAIHGARCKACDFDFGVRYGPIGAGYIQIHHKTPVSQMGDGYVVNPSTDLVPLCANCHAIAHRRDPPIPIDELQSLLRAHGDVPPTTS